MVPTFSLKVVAPTAGREKSDKTNTLNPSAMAPKRAAVNTQSM